MNVDRTLNVKINQAITFNSLADKTFGDPSFALSGTSTSDLLISYLSSDETIATILGSTVTIVGAGSVTIVAKQDGNEMYHPAAEVAQTVTVNKANQIITFNSIATRTFGDPFFTLSATATSNLPITYSSSDETVATLSGNKITIVGAGTSTITARQAGDGNYNSATDVTQALVVSKTNQAITFHSITAKTFGDAPFNLTATSTSGLAVKFSSISDKISLSGNQVTLVKPGSVTIKADQIGNTNFSAAASVSQSFCINPSKPTITTTGLNSDTPVLNSSSSIGNQWYRNGTLITNATSTTFSPTAEGSYSVKVTVDNCSSELSTEQVLLITGDDKSAFNEGFYVYPNPTSSTLTINLTAFDGNSEVSIVIYDLLGKTVEKISRHGNEAIIFVGSYSSGTYYVKASQRSQSSVAKFVKE